MLSLGCIYHGRQEQQKSIINKNFSLNISQSACKSDADCIHFPSCCHRNAQKTCITKEQLQEMIIKGEVPNCKGVECTMQCMPCTTCKCINGSCVAIKQKEGCC